MSPALAAAHQPVSKLAQRAKDKGKQAAHHIVCEQHAPLFILHRAPASKLVPPSHPFLREKTETIIPGARNSHAAHR